MKSTAIAYITALLVMVAMDALWLGFIAKPLYQQGIGHLMADAPNLVAAAVFYFLFPAGLVFFAVLPERSWTSTLTAAALFGFFTYATYDLSNLATLKGWPISLAVIDMGWGCLIATASAAASKAALATVR